MKSKVILMLIWIGFNFLLKLWQEEKLKINFQIWKWSWKCHNCIQNLNLTFWKTSKYTKKDVKIIKNVWIDFYTKFKK